MALTMGKLGDIYAAFFQALLEESDMRATRITVDEHITGTSTTPAPFNTGISDSVVYDVYISTAAGSSGNVYQCTQGGDETTALWQYKFSIPGGAAEAGNVNSVDGIVPGAGGDVDLKAVRYGAAQTLAIAQQLTVLASIGAIPRMSALPAAEDTIEGLIVQFTGTTGTYTNGYFYKCQSDGGTGYEWVEVAVGSYATAAQGMKADTAIQPATIAALSSGGVVSGGFVAAMAAPGPGISISETTYITDEGEIFTVSADSAFALPAADGSYPRCDLVTGDASGAFSCTEGTAAASPAIPATPAHHVLLAVITRAANEHEIHTANISDQRSMQPKIDDCLGLELLWENSSPLSSFAGQKISLDLTPYEYFKVTYVSYAGATGQTTTMVSADVTAKVGEELTLFSCTAKNRYRQLCTSDSTGITFTDATQINTYGSAADATISNATSVPIRIYGVRRICDLT